MDADLTPVIGQRLREMRKMRGLTVREQAKLLKISPSTLSELERGIAGISLQRLQSVAQSLGVSISDLLTHEGAGAEALPLEIKLPADVVSSSIRRGRGVHYALIGANGQHALQPYRITFDAGAGYADDPIKHPGDEFVYVLFGEVYLHLGDERHLLGEGSFARFDSGIPHAFSNASIFQRCRPDRSWNAPLVKGCHSSSRDIEDARRPPARAAIALEKLLPHGVSALGVRADVEQVAVGRRLSAVFVGDGSDVGPCHSAVLCGAAAVRTPSDFNRANVFGRTRKLTSRPVADLRRRGRPRITGVPRRFPSQSYQSRIGSPASTPLDS